MSQDIETGKVKWFNDEKGYGFITPDDGSNDLFIHHTNIVVRGYRTLEEGQTVSFKRNPNRLNAIECSPTLTISSEDLDRWDYMAEMK